jgi:hypothetical protein
MATINSVIRPDDLRKDKTWNVKIRIGHKGKEVFMKTNLFVEKWQIDKSNAIKDKHTIDLLRPIEKQYQASIDKMYDVEYITAAEIKERLLQIDKDAVHNKRVGSQINIIAFARKYISDKVKAGKASSITGVKTVLYSLIDYFNTENVDITEINFKFLTAYEIYLRSERVVKRNYRAEKTREVVLPPINDAGLHNHMRDLRLIFNEARSFYNDEDTGTIKIFHYPFKKYKVGSAPLTAHRNRTIEEIKNIRDLELEPNSRAELARDLFMLSYYMVGMNASDMFELPEKIGARLNYNRAKTRGRRKDKAFISVKVIDEARPLFDKYAGRLQKRYANKAGLNAALDKGLAVVSEKSGVLNIDFYDARHTVGSEARNTCGFSFEDVQIALNQRERTVTDTYVAPDWSVVDRVQAAIVKLLMADI